MAQQNAALKIGLLAVQDINVTRYSDEKSINNNKETYTFRPHFSAAAATLDSDPCPLHLR